MLRSWGQQHWPSRSFTQTEMKRLWLWSTLLLAGCFWGDRYRPHLITDLSMHSPLVWVDPFIGTGGHGHTYPGATAPFGLVQLSPDTRLEGWDGCSGYHYSDSLIYGFSHTHLSGTGVSDYGDVLLMPEAGTMGDLVPYPQASYASPFSKQTEKAKPGYYSVFLDRPQVRAELTATTHCGVHRYTYRAGKEVGLVLDLAHRDPVLDAELRVVDSKTVEGFRRSNAWARDQHVYFRMEFSRPMVGHTVVKGAAGRPAAARLRFGVAKDTTLLVRVGVSGVDVEGARKNLAAEVPKFDFDATLKATQLDWDAQLEKITVQGGTREQKVIFYTALYHTMIVPNTWSDVDGRYRGMDGKIHVLPKGDKQYTVFSLWDTFRAAHPLYTLLEGKRVGEFVRTFLRQYNEGGLLPVWELAGNETDCMIGYHSVSVIVDAYLKGIKDFDAEKALAAMVKSANQDRLGLDVYRKQGMIGASDEAESVSKTLEYAYDDWCIAQFARAIGRMDVYAEFIQRAQYYKNLYDPTTGFFRARMNGGWMAGFDPREVNFNFTEANAWQYSLFAPQNIGGLMDLKGGAAGLERHLDSMFVADTRTTGREQADITGLIGQYAHGNEPSHHMVYLYAHCGRADKAQGLLRKIMDELYTTAPDGLSGNEDCGQMSAWLVMSAMGFYPVTPGSPHYVIGTPWFPEVTLHIENGKAFTIKAEAGGEGRSYVASATLNGGAWKRPWLSHADVLNGGELVLRMDDKAHTDWFSEWRDMPALRIEEEELVASPYFSAKGQTFVDSLLVEIHGIEAGQQIRFSTDANVVAGKGSSVYTGPIVLRADGRLSAVAEGTDGRLSMPAFAEYYKIPGGRSIALGSKYENQYAAGGNNALIDRLRGGVNFRTGRWQGYQEDLVATVDLGEVKTVRKVGAGFLQDIGSWIWFPTMVQFEGSVDGVNFESLGKVGSPASDRDYRTQTSDFTSLLTSPEQIRYIRVRATNYGVCPTWHLGAGGKTWIFADEIIVE